MNTQGALPIPFSFLRDQLKRVRSYISAFPHITRLFSANIFTRVVGKATLWLVLVFVVFANVYMAYGKNNEAFHAIHLFIMKRTSPNTDTKNILGTTDTKSDSNMQTTEIRQQFDYWKSIIRDHPDYRDAYVQAAMHAYQLGLFAESRAYIEKAKTIDPNFTGISSFEEHLPKK